MSTKETNLPLNINISNYLNSVVIISLNNGTDIGEVVLFPLEKKYITNCLSALKTFLNSEVSYDNIVNWFTSRGFLEKEINEIIKKHSQGN
ncbi:MAG: hypothetical protein LBR40_02480 [Bacilli bacterium]|nr:hypothetical protein [Bacilli bacterium]